MTTWIEVGLADEIPLKSCLAADINGKPVAIFNVNGTFYAVADRCPHEGAPLSRGSVRKNRIVCALHNWSFPLLHPDEGAPRDKLPRYRVRVEDGRLFVEDPEA